MGGPFLRQQSLRRAQWWCSTAWRSSGKEPMMVSMYRPTRCRVSSFTGRCWHLALTCRARGEARALEQLCRWPSKLHAVSLERDNREEAACRAPEASGVSPEPFPAERRRARAGPSAGSPNRGAGTVFGAPRVLPPCRRHRQGGRSAGRWRRTHQLLTKFEHQVYNLHLRLVLHPGHDVLQRETGSPQGRFLSAEAFLKAAPKRSLQSKRAGFPPPRPPAGSTRGAGQGSPRSSARHSSERRTGGRRRQRRAPSSSQQRVSCGRSF